MVVSLTVIGQQKKFKFPKVEITSFEWFDNNQSSAYEFINRSTYFEVNKKGKWTSVTIMHQRIKVNGQEDLNEIDLKFSLKQDDSLTESIKNVQVSIHVLNKNKVKRKKYKSEVITINNTSANEKVALIEIPESSFPVIIDLSYTFSSPFYRIPTLKMQEYLPIQHYSATIRIPSYFEYDRRVIGSFRFKAQESQEFRDVRIMNTKQGFTKEMDGYFKESVSETVLQVSEFISEFEMSNIPSFESVLEGYRIRYDLINAQF